MTGKDITRIRIGRDSVGLIGLKEAIAEMAEEYGSKSDEEVMQAMMERLGRGNYIASSAREEYEQAFVREFRKALGQPYTELAVEGVDVKVLGPGCAQCEQLEQILMQILGEIHVQASVEHVRDLKEIARYGVMGTPALLINKKVMAVGSVPPRNKIKKWLQEADAALKSS